MSAPGSHKENHVPLHYQENTSIATIQRFLSKLHPKKLYFELSLRPVKSGHRTGPSVTICQMARRIYKFSLNEKRGVIKFSSPFVVHDWLTKKLHAYWDIMTRKINCLSS